jgi:hypothetical protein
VGGSTGTDLCCSSSSDGYGLFFCLIASLKERKREKCAARTKLARMCDKLTKTLVNLESDKTHQKKVVFFWGQILSFFLTKNILENFGIKLCFFIVNLTQKIGNFWISQK